MSKLIIKIITLIILAICVYFLGKNLTPERKFQSYALGVTSGIMSAIVGCVCIDMYS